MGRPPQGGGPAFRFTQNEVSEMEICLQKSNNVLPTREIISHLAEKFSASADRAGKIIVQPKQVWNWFQNRRYAQRARLVKAPVKVAPTPLTPSDPVGPVPVKNVSIPVPAPSEKGSADIAPMEFEAKSARDGAWYDVANFISHRMFETGDPEVRVRFAGFGTEEDEWVNVRRCVRHRSLPCEATECVAVVPGDLVLCFQEGKEQALYFDAHVLDAQRRRHDVRGCRCRFLVQYDHDQAEEIVPLRKLCRRPETDYRLQHLQSSKEPTSTCQANVMKDPSSASSPKDVHRGVKKEELVTTPSGQANETPNIETKSGQVNEPPSMETTSGQAKANEPPSMETTSGQAKANEPSMESGQSNEPPSMETMSGQVDEPPSMETTPCQAIANEPPSMESGQANEPPSVETTPMEVEKIDSSVTDIHGGGDAATTVNMDVNQII